MTKKTKKTTSKRMSKTTKPTRRKSAAKTRQIVKLSSNVGKETAAESKRQTTFQSVSYWGMAEAAGLPTFPEKIYSQLPPLLKDVCSLVDPSERDMVLLGSLAATSATMHNVSGLYGGSVIYPHIYTLVEAEAGVGKARLKLCNRLIEKVSERRPLEVSADTNGPRLVERLNELGGVGFVFSTEADLLKASLQGAHGKKMSSYLRLAFSHEKLNHSTKTDGETIVPLPRVALLVTGTPGQVEKLFNDRDFEDGLFTRFLIYHKGTVEETRNNLKQDDPNQPSLQERIAQMSDRFLECWIRLQEDALAYNVLADEEMGRVLKLWQWRLKEESREKRGDTDLWGLMNRYGEIVWRVTMVLTMLKYAHTQQNKPQQQQRERVDIKVHKVDFTTALQIVDTLLWHAIFHFQKMHQQPERKKLTKKQQKTQDALRVLSMMPDKFTIKQYEEAGVRHLNVSARTVRRYFDDCIAGTHACRVGFGKWKRKK